MADNNGRDIHTKKGTGSWGTWWSLNEVNDDDDNWTGENTNATTAHWTVSKAWDFYQGYFNRWGYDGSGTRLLVKAEESVTSSTELNGNRIIKFGNAQGTSNQESTIDIAAHEFTHGVLKTTCGPGSETGIGVRGENGALAESLADIMGLMTERYTLGDSPNNLTHGEDCGFISRKFDSRGFNNPADGAANRLFPTIYQQTAAWIDPINGIDAGGVHHNCAVMNFWFYLLTQGGFQTLPSGNTITVNSIGYDKTAQIVYRAINCGYFTTNSMFSDAREVTMRAARELYGTCSEEEIEVSKAWAAVNVGGVKLCPVSVSGLTDLPDGTICLPVANPPYSFQASEFPNSTFK